jgi:hypothetical protein
MLDACALCVAHGARSASSVPHLQLEPLVFHSKRAVGRRLLCAVGSVWPRRRRFVLVVHVQAEQQRVVLQHGREQRLVVAPLRRRGGQLRESGTGRALASGAAPAAHARMPRTFPAAMVISSSATNCGGKRRARAASGSAQAAQGWRTRRGTARDAPASRPVPRPARWHLQRAHAPPTGAHCASARPQRRHAAAAADMRARASARTRLTSRMQP